MNIRAYIKEYMPRSRSTLATTILYYTENYTMTPQHPLTQPCAVPDCDSMAKANHPCPGCLAKIVDVFLPAHGTKYLATADYFYAMREALHGRIVTGGVELTSDEVTQRHFLVTAHLEDCEDVTLYTIAVDAEDAENKVKARLIEDDKQDDFDNREVYSTMVAEISGPPAAIHTDAGLVEFPIPIQ